MRDKEITNETEALPVEFNFDEDYLNYRQDSENQELKDKISSEWDSIFAGGQQKEAEPIIEDGKPVTGDEVPERSIAADIGLGVMQAPRRIARGATQALQETIDIADDLGQALNKVVDLGTIQLTDKEGKFDLDFISQEERERRGLKTVQIPILDKPKIDTNTGQIIETVSQFLTGFLGAGKVLKAGGILQGAGKGTKFAKGVAQGALGDVLAFDEQEQRLSNVIESVPVLQNPVTEFLQAETNDGFAEGKLKQAVEGAGFGALTDGLVAGFKGFKAMRAASKAGAEEKAIIPAQVEEAAGVELGAKQFDFLGNAETEDLIFKPVKKTTAQEEEFLKTATPEQIKEAAKRPPQTFDDIEINFARIEGDEDIKRLMQSMANEPALKGAVQAARRGKVSNKITLKNAQNIDGFESLVNRRVGEAFNAEQITAARIVYYKTNDKLLEAAKIASRPEASAIDQFNFRKMIEIHHNVQKEVLGARAEAGRALQAWSIPIGGSGAENARALGQLLDEFGGVEASQNLAKRITALGDNITTNQINKITQKSVYARTVDAMAEAWTLGLLTNPHTHQVNMISNMVTITGLGMQRFIAALQKDSPISFREGVEFFHGLMLAQKEAIKNSTQAFKTGQTGFGTGKIELPRIRATSKETLDFHGTTGKAFAYGMDYYGRMVGIVGKGLAAGDEYAKTISYNAQVRALATRDGVSKGLSGDKLKNHIANLSNEPNAVMKADALDFANYSTFTRELGTTGKAMQRIIARNSELRFVVPFIKTPTNIFKFTYEHTPLAYLSSNVRKELEAGGARKALALSKIGFGTSLMMISADWAQNGLITGAAPSDPKMRAALYATGWRPYSRKIGDGYYSYSRFEPLATLLGLSTDINQILSNYEAWDIAEQEKAEELVTAAAIAFSNQVIGKTFLQGFADTAEVFSDPKRYMAPYLRRYASSLVPAGVAAIERAVDPELEYVFNLTDAFKSRIPGLSESVPKRRNIWGEVISRREPSTDIFQESENAIAAFLNPIYFSKEVDDPVNKWMLENGMPIGMPNKLQSFDGVRIDLREHPEIYERLVELRGTVQPIAFMGSTFKEAITDLVSENSVKSIKFFSTFSDFEEQKAIISQIATDYTIEAKKQLLEEYPVLEQIISENTQRKSVQPLEIRSVEQ